MSVAAFILFYVTCVEGLTRRLFQTYYSIGEVR